MASGQESTWAHGFNLQEHFRIQDQPDLTDIILQESGWLLLWERERTHIDSTVQFFDHA